MGGRTKGREKGLMCSGGARSSDQYGGDVSSAGLSVQRRACPEKLLRHPRELDGPGRAPARTHLTGPVARVPASPDRPGGFDSGPSVVKVWAVVADAP